MPIDKTNETNMRKKELTAPGWCYFLMSAITILAVFSMIFGSYQYHEREKMNEIFNAVYDSTMQAWYTDPMEGKIRVFRQFNAGDMRIYTATEVSDENPDGWKIVKKPENYKFDNGTIATIQCTDMKNQPDGRITCKGGAYISITGSDTGLLKAVESMADDTPSWLKINK